MAVAATMVVVVTVVLYTTMAEVETLVLDETMVSGGFKGWNWRLKNKENIKNIIIIMEKYI